MGSNTSRQRDARETQAVLDGVRRIVQALHESSRHAERTVGLTGAQLFVIQKLAEAGPLSMNGLAARTHTHQSSASTVASRLVDAGYIRRARSGDDGRSVELSLTAKGRRLAGRSPGLAQDRLVRGIEQLTTARRRALALALADLTHAMDAAGAAPSMFFEDGRRRASGRHHD